MKILIGSSVLQKYIDLGREPKDIDYFADKAEEISRDNDPFTHPEITKYFGDVEREATLDELYTIKYSHIFWDLRNGTWEKHAHDIMKMQEAGAKLIKPLYEMLYGVWKEVHGNKKANLNQDAKNFFGDAVVRKYDHDSVHASVAYYDRPLFERILADGEEVKVDKEKYSSLSYEDKLKLWREEIYATALERIVIPSDYTASPRKAYAWALRRTITSLASGKSAMFLVDNLKEFWKPDVDYVKVHKANSDKLIPIGG